MFDNDAQLVLCYGQHKDVFLIFIVFIWAFPFLWILSPIDVFFVL